MQLVEIGHVTFSNALKAHAHARNHEFFFVLAGSGTMVRGETRLALAPNTVGYCPPGVAHHTDGKGHGRFTDMLYAQCRFRQEPPEFEKQLVRTFKRGVVAFDAADLPLLDRLKQMFDTGQPLLQAAASQLFSSLIYKLCVPVDVPKGPGNHQYIEEAVRILQQNIYRHITNRTLADTLKITPAYFIRLFKKYTRTTPAKYLARLKMEAAAYLLKNTDRPVNRIADELGFYDEFHFSKAFKGFAGVPPRVFRRK